MEINCNKIEMLGSKGSIKYVVRRFWFRGALCPSRSGRLVVLPVRSCLGGGGNVGINDSGCGCEICVKRVLMVDLGGKRLSKGVGLRGNH